MGAAQLTRAAPNKGLELTASSVRSFVAPASGSSSGLALAVMKRGFAPLHENWSGEGSTLRAPSALKVEEPWCREPVR